MVEGGTEDSGRGCLAASRWLLLLTLKHKFWFLHLILLAPSVHWAPVWEYSPKGYVSPHFSQVDSDVTITQCVFHSHKHGVSGRSQQAGTLIYY